MSHVYWIRITKIPDRDQSGNGGEPHYKVALFADAPNRGSLPLAEAQCTNLWDMTEGAWKEAREAQDPYVTYGNKLAEWLFYEQGDRKNDLNRIGHCVRQAESLLADGERVRLLVSVERALRETIEFRDAIFFQSLTGAEHFRVEAVRTVWDESGDAQVANEYQKRPVAEKLQVLAVLANPAPTKENTQAGFDHLPSLEEEFNTLMTVLLPLRHYQDAPIVVETVRQPRLDDLDRAIQNGNPHVMVFLGHGYGWQENSREGGLACVDDRGQATRYGYARLQSLLRTIPGGANLRLAVLLACQSFVAAPGLLAHGVPAVVGMQPYRSINFPHEGAKPFAEPFFKFLAEFRPVGQALQRGIAGLRDVTWQEQVIREAQKDPRATQESLDWNWTRHVFRATSVMPTLWLAGTDDRLFAATEARQRANYQKKLSEQLAVEW